ncbi:MAG: glycosyltransferase family 39 protein [Acidobacteriota bacterium]
MADTPGRVASTWWWLTGLTLGALALRLTGLDRFLLWEDEAATWYFARLIVDRGPSAALTLEPTPPLYYGALGLWMQWFGDAPFVMRLPSALAGVLAVPMVFVLGRRLFDAKVAWVAACLIAIHPLHVFISREARVYPFLVLAVLVAIGCAWRAIEHDRIIDWAALSLTLILACYSHFYGMFLIMACGLLVVFASRGWPSRIRGVVAVGVAGLAFLPYVLFTLPHLRESGAAWSVEQFYRIFPAFEALPPVFELTLFGAGYHLLMRELAHPPTPEVLRLLALLAQAVAMVGAVVVARARGWLRPLAFVVVPWWILILVPWAITRAGRVIFQPGRHDVYVIGVVVLVLAVAIGAWWAGSWRGRTVAAVVMTVLVLGASHRLLATAVHPVNTSFVDTATWLTTHAEDDDVVVTTGVRRLITEYYVRQQASEVVVRSYPPSTDQHPGWSDPLTLVEDLPALEAEASQLVAELGALPDHATVWVVVRNYGDRRTSLPWQVDRPLFAALRDAGWWPLTLDDDASQNRIQGYRRSTEDG